MVGSCSFQERWLLDERFKNWLKKHPRDKNRAVCRLCNNKDFSIEKMGVSALVSHMNGKNHKSAVKDISPLQTLFFKDNASIQSSTQPALKSNSSSNSSGASINSAALAAGETVPTAQTTLTSHTDTSVAILDAEIRWALKVVMMHASYRSCLSLNELFSAMFPDSEISKGFKMSKTKVSYVIVFGLAEYFYNSLIRNVKLSPFFSLLFDESLNRVLNQEQMDLQIRFFNNVTGRVATRYLDSRFVYRPNAVNLSIEMIDSIKELDSAKLSMIGMDGPNVNWLICDKLNSEREKHNQSQLYNIGSCGLHSIHNAFETGMSACDWEVDKIMKAMHKLFDKSPARRDIYITINNSSVFPKRLVQKAS